jgi:hypothetical protein
VQRCLGSRAFYLSFVLAALAYIGLRLGAFLPSSIRTFPDSPSYLHAAGQPLLSADFLAGSRVWTLPLLYKVLPNSDAVRSAAQLTISIGCWLTLAAVAAWCVERRGLRPVAFCLVLLFSLSVWVTQWDPVILSQSLAVSLAALVLASWLAFVRAPGKWTIAAVLATTLLWSFTRDSNAYVSLFAVPFVLVSAMVASARRAVVVLTVGLVAIFGVFAFARSRSTAQANPQSQTLNVIGMRVLTGEGELEYFRDHGMPYPERLRSLAGHMLGNSNYLPVVQGDPRLAEFWDWIRSDGHQTLFKYLLTHPVRALEPPFRDPEQLFATNPPAAPHNWPIAAYRAPGTDALLPGPLAAVVYPPSQVALLAWFGLAVAGAGWLAWRGAARSIWLVPAVALVVQLPHAALVWDGDAAEIPLHALLVGIMTRLGLLLLSIFLIDAAISALRGRSAAPAEA